jgi:exosome complex component CSL4
MAAILVPGQPLPASMIAPPMPKCGVGCYETGGKILASVVGRPKRDGAVSARVHLQLVA